MPLEIERKFLVADASCIEGAKGTACKQGYLWVKGEAVVRARIEGRRAVLTLKGRTRGIARSEYEYEIPLQHGEEILAAMCSGPLVEKTRYEIEWAGRVWEVDVFAGDNEGLVVAEVELASEDEAVDIPPWVGEEVSGDSRYYNANLVDDPYCNWQDD